MPYRAVLSHNISSFGVEMDILKQFSSHSPPPLEPNFISHTGGGGYCHSMSPCASLSRTSVFLIPVSCRNDFPSNCSLLSAESNSHFLRFHFAHGVSPLVSASRLTLPTVTDHYRSNCYRRTLSYDKYVFDLARGTPNLFMGRKPLRYYG